MTLLSSILISIVGAVTAAVIIAKVLSALRLRTEKNKEAHKISIKPSVSFYLKNFESIDTNQDEIYVKNTGQGKAVNISIKDFYHPDEKNWCFKFQRVSLLDPGEEKAVDFDFIVGAHKAANKTDQLWVFDTNHDHDFAAQIAISYCDIEKNVYNKNITIGKENKKQSSRKRRLQQIQIVMSQSQRK